MQTSKTVRTGLGLGLMMMMLLSTSSARQHPRHVAKKVFFTDASIVTKDPERLSRTFLKQHPRVDLFRRQDKAWSTTLVAFFRRKSVPGPITIWLYDKADRSALKAREPVNAVSLDARPAVVFIHTLVFDPDLGFNAGHTYLVQVGQIIGSRNRIYAQGEVTLHLEK